MSPGRRKERRRGRSRLGLWTSLIVGVMLASYALILMSSRPHVSGDRLRFDVFVGLSNGGRILDARVLDEDAVVVGRYVADETSGGEPGAGAGGAHSHVHPGSSDGASDLAGGSTTTTVPGPAPSGPIREYNAPLVRGTQGTVLSLLLDNGVPITVDQQVRKRILGVAAMVLPAVALVVLFAYLIISSRRGTGLFAIRSGARKVVSTDHQVKFSDVAGQDSAITELRDITAFLSDPAPFAAVGASVPKGVLLYGPPGCGKTMLAKALATESGARFFSISGSDFVELYVGVGASRARKLFEEAREHAPALIFIDELDAVGRLRGAGGLPVANGEQEQALNQILAEMDGFATSEGIIVIGATNRPDVLDPALLRPGRFDRAIALALPDEAARLAILDVHTKGRPIGGDVDLPDLAHRAIGLTGADLAAVVNEGALLAARNQRTAICQADLSAALKRILQEPDRQRRLSMRHRQIGRRFTDDERATFADVAGQADAVAELAEVQGFLVHPERYSSMGVRPPRGVLLTGPPGCGKTLLARALAGEANAAFFSVSGSEFVEVFVGEGAARVRDLFAQARAIAPSILFIDEIDAIGARRGFTTGTHREQDQTLNQFLVELDGFEQGTPVVIIAATNRPDILDPALVRAGRFDRTVTVALPDRAGRQEILRLHSRTLRLAADVDLEAVARLSTGFSGADLANLVNEAALLAVREGRDEVAMTAFDGALDRLLLGVASRGTVLTERERAVVACHESGHALVALLRTDAPPPHVVSIVPHGSSIGRTWSLEAEDAIVRTRDAMIDRLAVILAGRAAELLIYGQLSSGSGNDLKVANDLARTMVCELGMSDALGARTFRAGDDRHSAELARLADEEIRRLLAEANALAAETLTNHRDALERAASTLLAKERLTGDELRRLVETSNGHERGASNGR